MKILLQQVALGAFVALFSPLFTLQAQSGLLQCRDCSVTRRLVASLGTEPDPVHLGGSSFPLPLTRGGYIALSFDRLQILQFDGSGKFVRQAGGAGDGPGEFRSTGPWALGPGDTLFVSQAGRVDVFSPQLEFVRSFRNPPVTPTVTSLAVLNDGRILVRGHSPARAGSPFIHMLSSDGTVQRSFGADVAAYGHCADCSSRHFVQASQGDSFLAVTSNSPSVEFWSPDGRLLRVVTISSKLFAADQQVPTGAPAARITGAWLDDGGVLWISGYKANPNWRGPSRTGTLPVVVLSANRTLDYSGITSIIQAVDPNTGRVLAEADFDSEMIGLLPNGLACSRRQDHVGVTILDVYSLGVRQ